MTQYSEEFKASIIAKMLPPNNVPVPQLVRETGLPKDTLYTWRSKHRKAQFGPEGRQVLCLDTLIFYQIVQLID